MVECFTGWAETLATKSHLLMAAPWLMFLLLLLVFFLLYRHASLSFGARRLDIFSHLIFAPLALMPLLFGVAVASKALLILVVLEYMMELPVVAIYQRRHSTYTFNIGLLLSLLTFLHLGFILLLPYMLFQIRLLESRSWRYYVAMLLGILTPWWIATLLTAPSPNEIGNFLLEKISPLWNITLPSLTLLPSILGLALLLLLVWSVQNQSKKGVVQRHRILLSGQRVLSTLLFVLYLLYVGSALKDGAFGYFIGSGFFIVMQFYYYQKEQRAISPFILVALVVTIATLLVQSYFTTVPFLLNSLL